MNLITAAMNTLSAMQLAERRRLRAISSSRIVCGDTVLSNTRATQTKTWKLAKKPRTISGKVEFSPFLLFRFLKALESLRSALRMPRLQEGARQGL